MEENSLGDFGGKIFSTTLLKQSPSNVTTEIIPIKGIEVIGDVLLGGPASGGLVTNKPSCLNRMF